MMLAFSSDEILLESYMLVAYRTSTIVHTEIDLSDSIQVANMIKNKFISHFSNKHQ
jgi:hypothetical protein